MNPNVVKHLALIAWYVAMLKACGNDLAHASAGASLYLDPPISYLAFHVFATIVTLANALHDRWIAFGGIPSTIGWNGKQRIWHLAKWTFFFGLFVGFILYSHPPSVGLLWTAFLSLIGWRLVYGWGRETCNTCKQLRGFVLASWLSANVFTIFLEVWL